MKKDTVTFIRYGFTNEALFGNRSDIIRLDIEQSIHKFIEQCNDALQSHYPNAEVEIVYSENAEQLSQAEQTTVFKWEGFEEVEDMVEIDVVAEICERVYLRYGWLVSKPFVSLVDSLQYGRIPPVILRWMCVKGFVNGAIKVGGRWEIPPDELAQIDQRSLFFTDVKDIERKNDSLFLCYWEEVADFALKQIQANTTLLITHRNEQEKLLLNPTNSLFVLSVQRTDLHIGFEQFNDLIAWTSERWSYHAYVQSLKELAERYQLVCSIAENENVMESIQLVLPKLSQELTFREGINVLRKALFGLIELAELKLSGGPIWEDKYHDDEDKFCRELLHPLLRKMGFLSVRYTHGPMEKGRDFVFAEATPFGEQRYYGLQAKAGDVRGGVRSQIDELLRQIDEAFSAPYYELGSDAKIYISTMIVAISGRFTNRAKDRIVEKLPPSQRASIYFLDKEKLLSLITYYWNKEQNI